MKKIFAFAMALALTMSLAACGGSKPAETPAPEAPAETPVETPAAPVLNTVSAGKLTVATSPDFAPYEFYAIAEDGTPSLAGFDVALAGYVADYLGLELDIIPMEFDGVLAELATGNVDLGMAGLSPDPDRMDVMDFSDIYYAGGQSFVTTQAKKDMFPNLDAANGNVSVAAQIGSIQMGLAEEFSPDADIVPLPKVTDIIAELISGKLDGAYIETAVAVSYQANYPELHIVCDVPYDVEGSAIGVKKDNAELLAGVNEAIAAALADGSMDQFVATANEQASGNILEGLLDG